VIVPSTAGAVVPAFISVTVPVGTGVVCVVPNTDTENVTLCPTVGAAGLTVSVVMLAAAVTPPPDSVVGCDTLALKFVSPG
jgi:hypothetical protein